MKTPTVLLAFFLTTGAAGADAAALTCRDLPLIAEALSARHYSFKNVDNELRARTARKLVEQIDPSKTLLLMSDVSRIEQELPQAMGSLRTKACDGVDDAFDTAITRADEDLVIVQAELGGTKFKLDESVELTLDPDSRGHATTPEERKALVHKLLHFQIATYLSAGMDLSAAKKQLVHRYELVSKRLREHKATRGPETLAQAMALAFDPHSSFLSADTLADFEIQMRLSLEGIGAALSSQDGMTSVESLVPGGQAEKTNQLKPGDKILAVAQHGQKAVSTIDLEIQQVVKMIRGPKGTKVTLTVLRDKPTTRTFDVVIVRDKIDVKDQAAKITYESRKTGDKSLKIAVIELPSFYGGKEGERSSGKDLKKLLLEATAAKVDGVVLDLSKNGGGLLDEAVRISGLFIDQGPVVATKESRGRTEVLADEDPGAIYQGPLVVLISAASASAAEILAGALHDHGRALVVGGERTFGKGTVQTLIPLPGELGAVKVTVGMFFLPGGASTQQRGVPSDVRIPSFLDGVDLGERKLDYALPAQSIPPLVQVQSSTAGVDKGALAMLSRQVEERVAKNPVFKEISDQAAEAQSKKPVKVADMLKKSKGEKEPKSKFEAFHAAFVREGVSVIVDVIGSAP